jgi:hypothetical protein
VSTPPFRYGRPMTAAALMPLLAANAARAVTGLPPCANPACRKPRRRLPCGRLPGVHGWCSACTSRWYKAWRETGHPPEDPPPAMTSADRTARSGAASRAARDARLAEFAESRALGFSVAIAAADAGVAVVTGWKYEGLLAATGEAA